MRRRFAALVGRLNRSRAGSASLGSFLENAAKLLQVIAIVVGAAWVLIDYFEFKNENNRLNNAQLKLANQTAELNKTNIDLTNRLNTFKLTHSTQGRFDASADSTVVRVVGYADGTFLYRFQIQVDIKNLSDANVSIPALVVEFFIGTYSVELLKRDEAFLINLPSPSRSNGVPGSVKWTRIRGYLIQAPATDKATEEVQKLLPPDLVPTAGGFVGDLGGGMSAHWNADFVLRARPESVAGAVLTFWAKGENESFAESVQTRTELLSEAQDAPALRTQSREKTQDTHADIQDTHANTHHQAGLSCWRGPGSLGHVGSCDPNK
jgi:hypothetical protein